MIAPTAMHASDALRPFCFVLMPFGVKHDPSGRPIDFDALYRDLILPAISDAGLDPIRADKEAVGGIIHKPMFERLMLCEYAVADLTIPNANVFYELGIRHVVRPHTTVSIFAAGARLPFDVNFLRCHPYALDSSGHATNLAESMSTLTTELRRSRAHAASPVVDSPVYQLIDWWRTPEVQHEKTDTFRSHVEYARDKKRTLAAARDLIPKNEESARAAIDAVRVAVGDLAHAESALIIDMLLSYRAVGSDAGYHQMLQLVHDMPQTLAQVPLVQEQLAFALNRIGRDDEAERVLRDTIARAGPSSETFGLLGRVLKDRWRSATHPTVREAARRAAVSEYLRGFETDWRDAYPGVNAVTLLEIGRDPTSAELLPIVKYAVARKIASGRADYWDHASNIELAVVARDEAAARESLYLALPLRKEPWMGVTTANNLRDLRQARGMRHEVLPWALDVEEALRGIMA